MRKFFFYGLLTPLLVLSSCSSDSDFDGIEDDKDKCPNTAKGTKVDKKGCKIIARKLEQITYYFDASESNKGYYYSGSKFNSVIAPLLNKSLIYKVDINSISDQKTISLGSGRSSVQKFIQNLGVEDDLTGLSSTIDKFFAKIMKETDSSEVSVLISDCILSYPDEILNINPKKNLNDAKGNIFKTNVESSIEDEFSFRKNRSNLPAFSVYALTSDFKGKYYNCLNKGIKIDAKERPFYIWVLAKDKDILKKFHEEIIGNCSDFYSAVSEEMHFGLATNEAQNYTLHKVLRKGKFAPNGEDGIRNVVLNDRNKEVIFTLSIDLPDLKSVPIEMLNKKLKFNSQSMVEFNAEFILKSELSNKEKEKLNSNDEKKVFNNSSHLLKITINEMLVDEDVLEITMPFAYPNWYKEWYTQDDQILKGLEGKTFAFDQIILAFQETMQDDKKNIINIKIPIKK